MTEPVALATDPLERGLARLLEAADAAGTLGLPTDEARTALDEARTRLGYPSDVFVLALVGGTGVGKSSLLNAVAGTAVSVASVRRPTTSAPIAWVPAGTRTELTDLLAWLEVGEVREHDRDVLRGVAILDLPDMDSIAAEHRARVERSLPRVDAVAWVTDPEKYHDAVLADDFLRAWLPRLARQAIVLNKTDRLAREDVDRVRRDLERDLDRDLIGARSGRPSTTVPVLPTTTLEGASGVRAFLDWLAAGAEAKAVIRERVAATVASRAERLAMAAGVDPAGPDRPYLDSGERRALATEVTAAILRAMDLPGLQRQAVAATRARARARGTGPMGLLTSAVYRLSGRQARAADPDAFLMRWRERGSLAPAIEALRLAMTRPLAAAAPAVRPALAATVEPAALQRGLEAAVDRAVARHDRTIPDSRVWPVIGVLQTLATGAIVLSVAWTILWVFTRVPVDSAQLPVLGAVPMPFVAVVGSLLAGYLLARAVGIHAGWVGRRWAGRLRTEVSEAVGREVAEQGLAPLDRLEGARHRLWESARDAIALRRTG